MDIGGLNESLVGQDRIWIDSLKLTHFRNYKALSVDLTPQPVVLSGDNGCGKTNLLEAVSLLGAGKGLRNASYSDLAHKDGSLEAASNDWVIASKMVSFLGEVSIGTTLKPLTRQGVRPSGRMVRIEGQTKKSASVLDRYSHIVWITPALDGLLTGSASERRRFLDHLIIGLDPSFRALRGLFERAMRQRNKLFDLGSYDKAQFEGLEIQMAQSGVALGAARLQAVDQLSTSVQAKWYGGGKQGLFPWSRLSLSGFIEQDLRVMPALEAEDHYFDALAANREKDRAAKRSLIGPHRSDFTLTHGPKDMAGAFCSTGEQKALLVGLMLAYMEQVKSLHYGQAPLLLLDEVAAHLDDSRRTALFEQILALKAQVWLTGTDLDTFAPLQEQAQFFSISKNQINKVV